MPQKLQCKLTSATEIHQRYRNSSETCQYSGTHPNLKKLQELTVTRRTYLNSRNYTELVITIRNLLKLAKNQKIKHNQSQQTSSQATSSIRNIGPDQYTHH